MRKILGLDLGTTSVGWALLNESENGFQGIVDMGVRIFQEVTEGASKKLKNKERQEKRSARRQIERKARRKVKVAGVLKRAGFIPFTQAEYEKWEEWNRNYNIGDPHDLRLKALDQQISKEEFGKIMIHLSQRRGFKSNRKAETQDDDDGIVKASIKEHSEAMLSAGHRTIGEFIQSQPLKRGRYLDRSMFHEEFEKIWKSQSKHDPQAYTEELKSELWHALFFQRPLKVQTHLIGKCDLEPLRKRCQKSSLKFQEFRILCNLANLQIIDPIEGDSHPLTQEEKNSLFTALNKKEKLTWTQVRKILGIHKNELINLQEGGAKNLQGNQTAHNIIKAIGEVKWDSLSIEDQDRLVTEINNIESIDSLLNRLLEGWTLERPIAEKLLQVKLETGNGNYSNKAITAILPYLKEGKNLWQAKVEAGYEDSQELGDATFVPQPEDIRNPVVMKVIHETRKVVNAIIREYGKPDVIRIEMARDLKQSQDDRRKYQQAINKNNLQNEKTKKILCEEFKEFAHTSPTREDIVKYRLWEECKLVCPYSGQAISKSSLFSGAFEVEHIIPYSLSFDNSYGNKTLCHRDWNQRKGNQTPFQAFGKSEDWLKMLQRIGSSSMSFGKKMRFKSKDSNDFDKQSTRQLNDTRYASKAVASLLKSIGVQIQVSQGRLTHAIRHKWRLNRLLADNNTKNRDDHRHHALDALITALVSPKLLQKISHLSQNLRGASLHERIFELPMPWSGFVNETNEKIHSIIVSHAPQNKITGAIHKEAAYGKRSDGTLAIRKSLNPEDQSFISISEISMIRDAEVSKLINQRLENFGFESSSKDKKKLGEIIKEALSTPIFHKDGKTQIKKVRLQLNKSEDSLLPIIVRGKPLKFHALRNNHHVEIFSDNDGNWKGSVITAYEALTRVKKKGNPYARHMENHSFVMTLAKQEIIEVEETEGLKYYRLKKFDVNGNLTFQLVHSASDQKNHHILRKSISTLSQIKPKKILINPIGKIGIQND